MNTNSHTESSGKEYSFGDVLLKFTQPNMLIFPEMLVSAVVSGGTHRRMPFKAPGGSAPQNP